MTPPMDPLDRLSPPPDVGSRVSVAVAGTPMTEAIGFVTALSATSVAILDQHGVTHTVERSTLVGARLVPLARGRNPLHAPLDLLDALAHRVDASGQPHVIRISELLAGTSMPDALPGWGPVATIGGHAARVEGEWVTLGGGSPQVWVTAAWWATRMGARSVQVRTDDPATTRALRTAGFSVPPSGPR